jgi:FkbM family methyltransferase
MANLSLNPETASKIEPSNAGIADVSGKITFNVSDTSDSGSRSTRNDETGNGVPIEMEMQKAGDVIRRVREQHPDSDIIMKVDCEGAEYDIFESLEREGQLAEVSTFMVEWHNTNPGKNQQDLIWPLTNAGFTVFDRSPAAGNGFFYAVR